MAKTPCGSAATIECEKEISRSNFSKQNKKCKDIRVRDLRADIRKRSLAKRRAKRVGSQRSWRAAKTFKKLEELREQLHGLEQLPLPPKPEPFGLKKHPLDKLSRNAALFEFIFTRMENKELLLQICFKKTYLLYALTSAINCHLNFRLDQCKACFKRRVRFSVCTRKICLKQTRILFLESGPLQKYRSYLQTTYHERIENWLKDCEEVNQQNTALKAPVQEKIVSFGESKHCVTVAEFEAICKARFVEKDSAYETKMTAKEMELDGERRFRATFGDDSDSDDE